MALTDQQKEQVARWVNEGLSISDVQQRLSKELGVSMTYMDVRFLIDDLDLSLQEKAAPAPQKPFTPPPIQGGVDSRSPADEPAPFPGAPADDDTAEDLVPEDAPAGTVSVSLDKIVRPGAMISGSVTFSDGVSAQWQIDQMGRLGIIPGTKGYKPSQADIQEFQVALNDLLQRHGY